MMQARPMILALDGADREVVQNVLGAAARQLAGAGARVLGVVEEMPPGIAHEDVLLRDLVSGVCHRLHQDLGPGASGCTLDPEGLAAASGEVEHAIAARLAEGGDLSDTVVILSKFGRQEAEGRGLTSAFHAAVAADMAVLTSVSSGFRAEWAAFAGDLARHAPARLAAVEDWWSQAGTMADRALETL